MESAHVDDVTEALQPENLGAEGGGRSVWVVLGFVALGVLGALAALAGYLRQSELLGAESDFEAHDHTPEPVVAAYAPAPSVEVEPLVVAEPEPEEAAEPFELHVVDVADVEEDVEYADAVNATYEETEVAAVDDDRADEVPAVDVPALDEAPASEVPSEGGDSHIDFEPAALFADPLAMRDRRGSLRR
jgi:hypothetical protein